MAIQRYLNIEQSPNDMQKFWFITLLTLFSMACEKNVNKTDEVTSSNAETATTMREIPVKSTLIVATVDQLRIRREPSLESVVLRELKEGDSMYYLQVSTVKTTPLELRGEQMNTSWLKVQTLDSLVGWTYGGGVEFK